MSRRRAHLVVLCALECAALLGNALNGPVDALTVYGGALIAGGEFTTAGGVGALYIARWDGSAWNPMGNGMLANCE